MFRQLRTVARAKGLDELLAEVMVETEDELLDLLRSQLEHGEKGDGKMDKYDDPEYAAMKKAMGSKAPDGIMDLKLTGSFQNKLHLIMTKRGARIRSKDKKSPLLRRKFSNEIFELNSENATKYLETIIYPNLIEKMRNELFK